MKITEKTNSINNDCAHCAYCIKHYGNLDGSFYVISGSVHCGNPKLKFVESNKRIKNRIQCEHWEPEQVMREKRRESIIDTLCKMAKQLDEIAQILNDGGQESARPTNGLLR